MEHGFNLPNIILAAALSVSMYGTFRGNRLSIFFSAFLVIAMNALWVLL